MIMGDYVTKGYETSASRGPKVNQRPLGLGNTPTESTTGPNEGWWTRCTGFRDRRLPWRKLGHQMHVLGWIQGF